MSNNVFQPYSKAELQADATKKKVKVTVYRATPGKEKKPFVIVIPGGAYGYVNDKDEGRPIAKQFNEYGYDAFTLRYRLWKNANFPNVIDDLAATVKYLLEHANEMGLSEEYVVCGFSAGGNLTALWGTDNAGYSAYDLPAPKALIPVYPLISYHIKQNALIRLCYKNMYGKDPSQERIEAYEIPNHVTASYPPSYICNCLDDMLVPPVHSSCLKDALDKAGVRAELEQGKKGNHGFGDGKHSSVKGWIGRAVAFVESL